MDILDRVRNCEVVDLGGAGSVCLSEGGSGSLVLSLWSGLGDPCECGFEVVIESDEQLNMLIACLGGDQGAIKLQREVAEKLAEDLANELSGIDGKEVTGKEMYESALIEVCESRGGENAT